MVSVVVYSKDDIVSGANIVNLINENRAEFAIFVSNAVIGKLLIKACHSQML